MKKIAIQGIAGSFHHIAATQYFANEELELICCATFEELFDQLAADTEAIGLMAIENTIAGSLLHNYELLRDSGCRVIGEHKLHISHSICCLPEDDWHTLTEVQTHPVALMQCRRFLSAHPSLKAVEVEDTAGAAQNISEKQLNSCAAICHAEAARMYGMKILQEGIEDNKHNFTRFLVIVPANAPIKPVDESKLNKAGMVFTLPHVEGSLSQVLSILSFYNISLTKIQSLPIIGREWEYMFYVDVIYTNRTRYLQSVDAIRPLTQDLRILGEYIGV